MREPPRFFTPFEWALVGLLSNVRKRIVEPRLSAWRKALRHDPVLARRLAAAFLYPTPRLGEIHRRRERELTILASGESAGVQPALDTLDAIVGDQGALLFNSYYFALAEAFGQPCLVPVIIGYDPHQSARLTRALTYIEEQGLPFHVDAAAIATYEQLLPLYAGRTPQYLNLYRSGCDLPRVVRDAHFIGDLSLLYRREDYLLGHLSSLTGIIGEGPYVRGRPRDCIAAFVLTSVVPSAFAESDSRLLDSVIDDAWTGGMLAAFNSTPRIYKRSIAVTHAFQTQPNIPTRLTDDRIQQEAADALSAEARSGAVLLHLNFHDTESAFGTIQALNSEGVNQLVRSLFPSGPHVHPDHVGTLERRGGVITATIDPAKLDQWVSGLEHIIAPSSNTSPMAGRNIWLKSSAARALSVLLGGTSRRSVNAPAGKRPQRRRRVALPRLQRYPLSGTAKGYELILVGAHNLANGNKDILAAMSDAVALAERALPIPDGENPVFAQVPSLWSAERTRSLARPRKLSDVAKEIQEAAEWPKHVTDDLANILIAQLAMIHGATQARAMVLVKRVERFFPTDHNQASVEPGSRLPAVRDASRSYPWFWTAERLSRVLSAEYVNPVDFSRFGMAISVPVYWPANTPMSLRPPNDATATSALTFLGAPLVESGGEPFSSSGQSTAFHDEYRQYLERVMRKAPDSSGLPRTFAGAASDMKLRRFRVFADPEQSGKTLTHELRVTFPDTSVIVQQEWQLKTTWHPLFVCLDSVAIRNDTEIIHTPRAAGRVLHMPNNSICDVQWLSGASASAPDAFAEATDAHGNIETLAQLLGEATLIIRSIKSEARAQRADTLIHEMRSPLYNAEGITNLLAARERDSQTRGRLRVASRLIHESISMVDKALSVTEADSRGTQVASDTDVAGVLRDCASEFSDRISAAGLALDIQAPDNATVVLDPEALRQILRNLIENAIKFSRPATVISAHLEQGRDGIILRISDQGVGIAREDLERIFEPYVRLSSRDRANPSGLGLGLHLVRTLTERLGGQCTVDSSLGVGTTFTVVLPSKSTREAKTS